MEPTESEIEKMKLMLGLMRDSLILLQRMAKNEENKELRDEFIDKTIEGIEILFNSLLEEPE